MAVSDVKNRRSLTSGGEVARRTKLHLANSRQSDPTNAFLSASVVYARKPWAFDAEGAPTEVTKHATTNLAAVIIATALHRVATSSRWTVGIART